jgi:hypothetical protein
MDPDVIKELKEAGVDISLEETIPVIPVEVDENDQVIPLDEGTAVLSGETKAFVKLKRISELFCGLAEPPDFSEGPTPEYEMFFILIESTVIQYCDILGAETDMEFHRLYRHLKSRPDGQDDNPLFSYIQAAFRLYMSLRDVGRFEFEAVARRLARSAKTFSISNASKNYYDIVSRHLK